MFYDAQPYNAKKLNGDAVLQAPAPATDEAAQTLIDIGSLVQGHADGNTAKALLDDINQRLDHLLLRLPPGYFDPLVSADSLSPEQAC